MIDNLFATPSTYVQSIDWARGAATAYEMDRSFYGQSSFLDPRTKAASGPVDLPLDEILAAYDAAKPARRRANYIFHIAFGGSTLLARCFEEPGVCMAYKEPSLLHELAFALRPEWKLPAGVDAERVKDVVMALAQRTFHADEVPLIKPSDSCTPLVRPLLEMHPESRALLLYSPLEPFAVSMLQHANRREYLRRTVPRARSDLRAAGLGDLARGEVTDAVAVGMVWLSQMVHFRRLAADEQLPVRTLASSSLFAAPLRTLQSLATFFGLDYPAGYFEHEIAEGAFRRDSKNTGVGFSPEAKAAQKKQLRADLAPELDAARAWVSAHDPITSNTETLARSILA